MMRNVKGKKEEFGMMALGEVKVSRDSKDSGI